MSRAVIGVHHHAGQFPADPPVAHFLYSPGIDHDLLAAPAAAALTTLIVGLVRRAARGRLTRPSTET
ncbi:hypothetical protein ACWDE0_31050 [Streptomyces sp. 900105755]|uniref:hypothetical protein n=1 Tax=Streptomyces sp. 900105755 TaxID=3154389 RepID=UPI00331C04EA